MCVCVREYVCVYVCVCVCVNYKLYPTGLYWTKSGDAALTYGMARVNKRARQYIARSNYRAHVKTTGLTRINISLHGHLYVYVSLHCLALSLKGNNSVGYQIEARLLWRFMTRPGHYNLPAIVSPLLRMSLMLQIILTTCAFTGKIN